MVGIFYVADAFSSLLIYDLGAKPKLCLFNHSITPKYLSLLYSINLPVFGGYYRTPLHTPQFLFCACKGLDMEPSVVHGEKESSGDSRLIDSRIAVLAELSGSYEKNQKSPILSMENVKY